MSLLGVEKVSENHCIIYYHLLISHLAQRQVRREVKLVADGYRFRRPRKSPLEVGLVKMSPSTQTFCVVS